MNVPMMASSFSRVAEALGLDVCQAMADTFRRRSSVPIIHHLDHSHSVAMCIEALDVGYPSVMIDGSKHPFQENIRMTREVVEYAHRKGAIVEGEIGPIMGQAAEGDFAGDSFLAKVDEAVELVAKTDVDSPAVGIGTAHGFCADEPEIHFDDAPGGFHCANGNRLAYARLFGTRIETLDFSAVLKTYETGRAEGYLGEVAFTEADVEKTFEKMRRAVPLLRSDCLFEPVGQQGHTYGLSLWLPFFGTGYNPGIGHTSHSQRTGSRRKKR